jgi:hypothetical protein
MVPGPAVAWRHALVFAGLGVLLLEACASLVDLQAVEYGAIPDGGPTEASVVGSSFCAKQSAARIFCSDFDRGPTVEDDGWGREPNSTVVELGATASSPPRAARIVREARVSLDLGIAWTATARSENGFRVRVMALLPSATTRWASLNLRESASCTVSIEQRRLVLQSATATTELPFAQPISPAWVEIVVEVWFEDDQEWVAVRAGAQQLIVRAKLPCENAGLERLWLGVLDPSNERREVLFDDVLVERIDRAIK